MKTQKYPSLVPPSAKRMSLGALLSGILTLSAQGALTSYINMGDGVWTVPLNWSNGVPGAGDIAIVGGSGNAENSDLRLNIDTSIDAINITDGMHFDTDNQIFTVSNADVLAIPEISINGVNTVNNSPRPSRLIVTQTNNQATYDISGRDYTMTNGGELYFEETAEVLVSGTLETDTDGAVVGNGTISFSGSSPINNNGIIAVQASSSLTLDGFGGNNALFNLDGSNGTGLLDASAVGATLNVSNNITGGQFDGTMQIGRNSSINLASSLLRMGSNDNPGTLNFSGLFNTGGTLSLNSGSGNLILQRGTTLSVGSGAATIDADLRLDNFTTSIVIAKQQLVQATTSLRITGETDLFGGAIEVGGILDFEGGLGQSENTSFKLDGGTVEGSGGTVFNLSGDNNPKITGNGTWDIGLRNEGSVEAQFGVLTIEGTGNSIDWDGPNNNGDLRAEFGSLVLKDEPGFQFRSDVLLGNNNSLSLEMPFSILHEGSRLTFQGEAEESFGGTLTTEGDLTIHGDVEVLNASVIDAETILEDSANVNLEADLTIGKGNKLTLVQGTTFSGDGTLIIPPTSRMEIPTSQLLTGSLEIAGKIFGDPTKRSRIRVNGDVSFISDDSNSFWEMSVFGPATNVIINQDWDRITADGKATLSGTLFVAFDVPQAQKGDSWKILHASEVEGQFDTLQLVGAVPNGTKMIQLVADDGVYLKLVDDFTTYAEWAAEQNFPNGEGDWFNNPDEDGLNNAAEMYLGGDPLKDDSTTLQPTGGLVEIDGEKYLTITVRRAHHGELLAVAAIFYQSINLEDWKLINLALHDSVYDALSCVSYDTYRMTEPVQVRPKVFLRAEFVLP